ncbi:MAG: serine hydrolase [Proteobacteria bacterium]|nr:serine hydrolase [Pseudomonadota bacterium]MBI3496601.1 serine hydrolase [Pseudomonadota bacterium]
MGFYVASAELGRVGETVVASTLAEFRSQGLEPDRFAMSLLLHPGKLTLGDPPLEAPVGFGYRSAEPFYPCSVVKLFYLVAAQARLAEGAIQFHEALDLAMRDMMLYSSNTATNYVIDLVTGTTGDTLLDEAALGDWSHRRQWVNRYFAGLGWPELSSINVSQKLMDDVRYGRERQLLGPAGQNHNRLTTDATARLIYELFRGRVVDPEHSWAVLDYLRRPLDPEWVAAEPLAQVTGFFGEPMPTGTRLWSKSGWSGWLRDPISSWGRHDAAYCEPPSGPAFTLVAFTQGKTISQNFRCLPFIAASVLQELARL